MDSLEKDKGIWPCKDLPLNWVWVPMNFVFNNQTSSDKKLKQKMYLPVGNIAVVDQGQEFIGGYTNDEDLTFKGDLPIIIFGDHSRCVKYIDFPFVQGADGVKVLSPTNLVDPKFSFYSLLAVSLPDKGYSRHFKFLKETSFPVPPLSEQKLIVAKIESINDRSVNVRKSLEAIPPLLEKFRQSVLASAFRGDLTADWRPKNPDIEPATKLLERIRKERRKRWEEEELAKMKAKGKSPKDDKWKKKYKEPATVDATDLSELPEGWCWATLESVSFIQGGVTLGQKRKKETAYVSVPYLRVANVQRGYLDLNDIKQIEIAIERLNDLYLQDGDVLFNEGGDRDKLGRGWVWRNEIENCTHQNHVFRGRLVGHIIPELLSYYSNEFGRNYFFQNASQSVNLASINKTMLSGLPVPIIPPSEQSEIYSYIQAAFAKIEQVEQVVHEAFSSINKLNQSILSKAFSGELVPQDPNDEPASQLLKTIKLEKIALDKEKKTTPRRKRGMQQKESRKVIKKNERRPLIEVLQSHSTGLSPEALFQQAGFDKDLVEEFYAELKTEVSQGNIIEDRPDQEQVLLRLKAA